MLNIGSRRELFVDHYLIDRLGNARLELHRPRREAIAFNFDEPWEGAFACYATVLKDGDTYRAYYRGWPQIAASAVVRVAESRDGIRWTKPRLGLHEVNGTRNNNVILVPGDGDGGVTHNFAPFVDKRPGVPEAERYKALGGGGAGLIAYASADGLSWKKMQDRPVFTQGDFDSLNVPFWSEAEGRYVCYFRRSKDSYRWISRTTSDDFLNWADPVEMDMGDTPPEHFYTNGTTPYFRAPHIYVALAKRFFPGKRVVPEAEAAKLVDNPAYRVDSSDSIFMTTRGTNRYDRTFMEAFIRPGPSPRDWIARDNTPACGVVPGDERTMFVYRSSHYGQPTAHMMRYSLRLDGFVSVNARYEGGEMVTKPFIFSGKELEINCETSAAGGIRIEIQNAEGEPVQGFELSDCGEIAGDQISRIVEWKDRCDVSGLAGKPVRLRFVVRDADLYSIRFRP